MAIISDETKKVLETNIGLPYEQLCGLELHEEISLVKAKTGKSPKFVHNPKRIGRGNVLLARGRFTTMEDVNVKIDALQNTPCPMTLQSRQKTLQKSKAI